MKDEVRRTSIKQKNDFKIKDKASEDAKRKGSMASLKSEKESHTVLPVITGRHSDHHSSERRSTEDLHGRQLSVSTKRALKAMTNNNSVTVEDRTNRLKQPEPNELLTQQYLHTMIKTPR